MTVTFEFDDWLDAADPCNAANVAGLVEAVRTETEFSVLRLSGLRTAN